MNSSSVPFPNASKLPRLCAGKDKTQRIGANRNARKAHKLSFAVTLPLLWDQPSGYVSPIMAAGLFHTPLALVLVAVALPASAATAELPGGDSEAFRHRMRGPADEAANPGPIEVRLPRTVNAPARLPRLSSRFGWRGDPLGGKAQMHSGIDIPGALGTPIQASAGGVVRFVGTAGGYGRMVEIAHGSGLVTRYAHLSQILVSPGAAVARGETIALMGSTGRSTGSHLHFEVRSNGHAADPLGYFGAAPPEETGMPGTSFTVWRPRTEPHVSQFARARDAAGSVPKPPL